MNNRGFTIIELLVVTSIIVIMTVLTMSNYKFGDDKLAIKRSAYRVVQTLRMAQEYAISSKATGGVVPAGYGVYFNLHTPATCILFADLNNDQAYSGVAEKVEVISFEDQIALQALSPMDSTSSLAIVFIPPDPSTVFTPDAGTALISLYNIAIEGTLYENIMVNKAGLIYID
jgi:prepilin-type N-terminal cleavage/methylation domain-containing protein